MSVSSPSTSATTGSSFDHVVIIAMENRNFSSVIGSSSAPFINSLAAVGSTMSSYHSYGARAFSGDSIGGCSAACYVAFMGGDTYGVSDAYSAGSVSGTSFVDQLQAAGLGWQAYCEAGCPRGSDHFPFTGFASDVNSPNIFASSSVSTSDFVAAANGASPPSFLWFTPTDGHNMHDNSVSTGDSYLQQFLVGSGTVQNPASGSLLASNMFRNAAFHTLLYLWWDEYDPSPNVEYGSMVRAGYISTASYDEYSSLRTLEDNWALSHLANAASAAGLTDLLTTGGGSQPVQTTAAVINSGIYPTRDWLTQKHTYSSTGVPSSGTLVEIKNAVLSNVANGAASGDCNDSSDTPTPPSGTWCDSIADASDGTGTVHVEIDQVYKYLGIAPTDWPANSTSVNIIGYAFKDWENVTSWEIHPVTAWSLSSSGTFTLTVSAGSGGTTSPVPGFYSEASGSVVTVTALPSSGYTFSGFTLDGVVSTANPILVTMSANRAVSASFSQSVLTTGNFGSCTSLPQGWSCGNGNGLSGTATEIFAGVAQTILFAQGVGNDNNYQYATTQKGTFPWSPCQPPASGVLPTNLSSVSASFSMLSFVPYGSYRYHIYVALYYWLPDGAVTAGGSTYQCLDTQSRVENINGVFSPARSTSTYDPGDSFGWDNVTLGLVATGQTYVLTADVAHQCKQDLTAWGLNPDTPCQLAGIEIGVEGFQFQELDVNWRTVQFAMSTTGTQPLTSSFNSAPSAPQSGQAVTFTGTAEGGTPSYSYTWSFGDGSTDAGQTVSHTYSTPGTYIVILTVKDSGSLQESVISQKSLPVTSAPPTLKTSFGFNPSSPGTGQQVTLTASTSGGTAPYSVSWSFGDGSTGGGSSTSHVYSSAGTFIVTLTVKDSGSPQQTATSQESISVAGSTPTLNSKFILSVQIFDADGAAEETITLNSRSVASVPSTYSPQNAQVYTRFNFNITNLVVQGANTLVFTHAPWDCTVYDNVENLAIIRSGINIFNDPANRTLNCNTLVTYTFYTPLSASFIFTPNSPRVGQSVTFTASAVGGFAPYTYTWNFNDGTKGTGQTATHVFPAGFDYNVTLTVADSEPTTVSFANTVSVNPPPTLTASFAWTPLSPDVGDTVTFTATISGGVTPYNMTWNFGDGTSGIGLSPTHTYTEKGVYYVTMNAADNIGEQATIKMQVTIGP